MKSKGWREIEILETYEGPFIGHAENDFGASTPLSPDDTSTIEKVAALAKESFRHDRLHADPLVPNDVADNFKAEWVRRACKEGGRRIVYVILGHRRDPDAFLICFKVGNKLVVDLIAVKMEYRGQGISVLLLNEAAARLKTTEMRAGTQSTNKVAKALYERIGLTIVQRERTLHK